MQAEKIFDDFTPTQKRELTYNITKQKKGLLKMTRTYTHSPKRKRLEQFYKCTMTRGGIPLYKDDWREVC